MSEDKKYKRKKHNSPLKYAAAAGVTAAVVAVVAVVGGMLGNRDELGSKIKVESVAPSLEITEAPETASAEPISIVLETTLSAEEIAEQEHDACQHQGQRQHKPEKRADHVVHLLAFFCTQGLGDQYLSAIGKAQADHGGKVDDLAGLGYGRKPGCSHVFAHDDHVNRAVKHLHGVGGHEGQGKPQKLSGDGACGEVFG